MPGFATLTLVTVKFINDDFLNKLWKIFAQQYKITEIYSCQDKFYFSFLRFQHHLLPIVMGMQILQNTCWNKKPTLMREIKMG